MPTTREILVYKFEELSPKAKEHAVQQHAEHSMDHAWWDHIYDYAKEHGRELGFQIDDIRFSGFWSQGDGASWTGRVHIPTFLNTRTLTDPGTIVLRELVENDLVMTTIPISRGGGMYVHENTMRAEVDASDYASYEPDDYDENCVLTTGVLKGANVCELLDAHDFGTVINEVIALALEEAKEYAQQIFKDLREEYEYQTREEHVAEMAEANDWQFDEDGDLI